MIQTLIWSVKHYRFVIFQVISTSGDRHEYLWTLERNLDMDTHYQAKLDRDYNN